MHPHQSASHSTTHSTSHSDITLIPQPPITYIYSRKLSLLYPLPSTSPSTSPTISLPKPTSQVKSSSEAEEADAYYHTIVTYPSYNPNTLKVISARTGEEVRDR
jgi:hypothetical protein